jgi:predicted metalloendopeptidase
MRVENLALVGLVLLAHAARSAAMTPDTQAPAARAGAVHGIDPANLDKSVAPCSDFFQFATIDSHPPARDGVNGTLAEVPAFGHAFACKPGDAIARTGGKDCQIW